MSDANRYRSAPKREAHEPAAHPHDLQTWESGLACPRCKTALFAARKQRIRVDACGGCGGVWLANEDAQRMLETHSRAAGELSEVAAGRARVMAYAPGVIACPECGAELARTVVPPHGIEVDACAGHGTWFDRHELDRVVDGWMPRKPAAPLPPVVIAAPVAPAPTAYEIAREVRWQEQQSGGIVDLIALLLK